MTDTLREPGTMERIGDPKYLCFAWARFLRREAVWAREKKRRTITLSAEGAEELAALLSPENNSR